MYDACSCDGDPPEFIHIEQRKARKPHKCDECRATFVSGESYEHVRGKWEGYIYTFKICALCLELRQWALISVPCFCYDYQSLHENVRDMVSEVRRDVPLGFVFEWGRRVIKIHRRRYGQHWPRRAHHAQINQRRAEIASRGVQA